MDNLPEKLKPGCCHKCGHPISANPHPDAGKPGRYLEVGCPTECIPCTVLSRHQWAERAQKAERELRELRKQLAAPAPSAPSDAEIAEAVESVVDTNGFDVQDEYQGLLVLAVTTAVVRQLL
jgi:hypothetical protein